MPDIDWSSEEVRTSDPIFKFPQFKPRSGESARICVIFPRLTAEYVHWLNVQSPIRAWICLGDQEVMRTDGEDPEHCPFCAVAERPAIPQQGQPPLPLDQMPVIPTAQRYFITHILKYRTRNDLAQTIQEPFAAEVLLWKFSLGKFRTLVQILEERKSAEPLKNGFPDIDLIVKCTNEGFQNLEIHAASGKAQWQLKQDRLPLVKGLVDEVAEDRKKGLGRVLGRYCKDKDEAQRRVDMALSRKSLETRVVAGASAAGVRRAAEVSMEELLEGDEHEIPVEEPVANGELDMDSILNRN